MEKMYFDAATRSFLGSKTHKGRIPENAVSVSPKRYLDLLAAQRETEAQISADAKGNPVLLLPDPIMQRGLALREVKREAGRRIEAIFPVTAQMNALRLGLADDPRFAAIDAIRAASNAIEQDLSDSGDPASFPISDHSLWPGAEQP